MSILDKVYAILNESEVIAHPKIEHNGELVHTHNSEGQRIHSTDEGVKKFHDWFGKSKVVDQHGRPQVMYHGTGADIHSFTPGTTWLTHTPHLANDYAAYRGSEHLWTGNKNGDPNVIPAYVRANNHFDVDKLPKTSSIGNLFSEIKSQSGTNKHDKGLLSNMSSLKNGAREEESGPHYGRHEFFHKPDHLMGKNASSTIASALGTAGFDSAYQTEDDHPTIGVFHPNQIKSAIGNNGSFSKESNKITESTQVDASELQANLKTKYPELKNLNLFDRGNDLRLDTIVVKKEHRNQGVGGRVLKDLKDHADKNGKRITLTAGVADPHMGTTSQSRLDKFYKSHGFVANKGRNKDFAITATHYYDGKLDEGFVKNAVGAALIAGAALGINHNLEKPTEVSQQLQIVKKPVPMNHEEAMSHIIKTYHVKPELAHTITTAAFKHGDPNGFPTPHHLLGLMATESSFNPKEVSKLKKDAAIGITQIRPITSGIDPKELTTVDNQVKHTTNILKDFHKRANGDVNMALSSYNNGFRAVYNDRPSVNKKYAPKVLKAVEQFHNPE